jgi:hypothetical protein
MEEVAHFTWTGEVSKYMSWRIQRLHSQRSILFDFRMMKSHMQNWHQCMAHQLSDASSHTKNQQSMHRLMWPRNWSQSLLQPQKAAIPQHFPCCTILIWLHTSSPSMSCSNVPPGLVMSPSPINRLMSRRLSSHAQCRHHTEKARYKFMMHPALIPVKVTTRMF